MPYTFSPTASGTIQVSDKNGIVSTTTADNAAMNYGYTPTPAKVTAPVVTTPTTPVPINPPAQPPKPMTAFSSDTANQYATDNSQKLQTLKNTGLTLGQDGLARYSDMSFATAPSDAVQTEDGTWQSGGVKYALGPATTQDPELQAMNDQITSMKTQFDATSRAQIDNIKAQFDKLIKDQTDINTRSQASLDQSLLMAGSSRYAQQSSTGQSTALMSYGIDKIADLNTKEQAAVIQAQQAMDAGDMKLMDESLSLAQKARDEKQAAAKDLSTKLVAANDKIQAQKVQASRDSAVGGLLSEGITDPSQMLDMLNSTGTPNGGDFTIKEINDAIANLNPDAKEIINVLGDAAKFAAPPDVLKAIGSAKSLSQAYQAAGPYLKDPTSNAAMYNIYAQTATAKGLTPMSAEDFLLKQKTQEAYATESAKHQSDANYTASDKTQQALEQQGRGVIEKEFSARTGALGVENAKVNQGNHLNSMFSQYYDPKTGNYNIPTAQYAELAIGLANMISPTGQSSDSDRAEIKSKTASGDLKGALQYITGQPQNGNTQGIIKNLVDSVDRQAQTAVRNRQAALEDMKAILPTDLEQNRKDALIQGTQMVGYEGQDRISKESVNEYVKANPGEADNIAKMYEIPGATDQDIEDYLKAQGKL